MSSDAHLDGIFRGARSARIFAGGATEAGPIGDEVLATFDRAALPALREALRVVDGEAFHCMCLGDLAIELRGWWGRTAVISFHHGHSLRVPGLASDVALRDGPALLRQLAARGVRGPLEDYERAQDAGRDAARAADAWDRATPAPLRALAAGMGPFGSDLQPDARAAARTQLREAFGDDAGAVRALLRWLACGSGVFSGYPSYEQLPIELLETFPLPLVVDAMGEDDADVLAAARAVASHTRVSFHRSALAAVPDTFFDRALAVTRARGHDDSTARLEHAQRLARAGRARLGAGDAPRAQGDLTVLGESDDGPLTTLLPWRDALLAVDVRRVVRFAPGSVRARPFEGTVAAPTVGAACASRAVVGEVRTGRLFALAGADEGALTPLPPVDGTLLGMVVTDRWLALTVRDAQHRTRLVLRDVQDAERVIADPGSWCLGAWGDTHLFRISGGLDRATLERIAWHDGAVTTLTTLDGMGASMATPRAVVEGDALLVGASRVLWEVSATGARRALAEVDAPIMAVCTSATHIGLLLAPRDDAWTLARLPRRGGALERLGGFTRRPYERHELVMARGGLVTQVDDRLLGGGLAP
ncbi:MAG: hypothetical protein U0325_01880 [Polyangiales bacterium]